MLRFVAIILSIGTIIVSVVLAQTSVSGQQAQHQLTLGGPTYVEPYHQFDVMAQGSGEGILNVTIPPSLTVQQVTGSNCSQSGLTISCSQSDGGWYVVISLVATTEGLHRVTATLDYTTGSQLSKLDIQSIAATATLQPTASVQPSATATIGQPTASVQPSATATIGQPTPAQPQPDMYEPNNTASEAPLITLGSIDKLNFYPNGDVDFFRIEIKPSQAGLSLTIQTFVEYGLDTEILVWNGETLVASNDDIAPNDLRSYLIVNLDTGIYTIEIRNRGTQAVDYSLYRLDIALADAQSMPIAPTATSQPTQGDGWENNYDFSHATRIAVGDELHGLTFVCPFPSSPDCGDNDFFKFQVKGGLCYIAESFDLKPGVDTNIIIFGPDRETLWGGNDDVTPDGFQSQVYFCTPAGMGATEAFALIGNVGNIAVPPRMEERTYSFRIRIYIPPTPEPQTAVPTLEPPNVTAVPATSIATQTPRTPPGTALPAPIVPTPANDSREVVREESPSGWAIIKVESSALYAAAPPTEKDTIATYEQGDKVRLVGQAYAGWVKVIPDLSVTPGWMWAADLGYMDTSDGVVLQPTEPSNPRSSPGSTSTPVAGSTTPPVVNRGPLQAVAQTPTVPSPPVLQPVTKNLHIRVCVQQGKATCGRPVTDIPVIVRIVATGKHVASSRTGRDGQITFSITTFDEELLEVVLPSIGVQHQFMKTETLNILIPTGGAL